MKLESLKLQITLFLLWISHFLVDMMIGIWPAYKTMAELDLAVAGMISGICAFAGEGMQVVFGPLSDRGYRKRLIWAGLLMTCASAFLSYTTHYGWLFFLFFLTCLGSGAFHPSAAGLAGSLTVKRKALFVAIFASGGGLGLAFSQLFFSHIHLWMDGRTLLLAIPTICISLLIAIYGLSGAQHHLPTTTKRADFKTLFGYFRQKNLRLLYIAQVSNQALFWALVFLLPDVLVSRGYAHWICFGGGHLFLLLGSSMMMVPSGYLADKYSPKIVITVALALSVISLYLFLFNAEMVPAILLSLMFFLGASFGLISPLLISIGNKLVPESPGKISAFLMGLAWCISEGIGQSGGGLLTKFFEEDAAAKALGILGILCLFCLFAVLRLPNLLRQENPIEFNPAIDNNGSFAE